jgi:undecaprenyl-diphosphatase
MLNFQILISNIADTKIMVILVLLVSGVLYFYKQKKAGLTVFLSSSIAIFITYALKHIFKIPRPENMLVLEDGYRFPSGHATMSAVIMSLVIFFSVKCIKNNFLKYTICFSGILWWLLVSNSRLYLGVHIPLDIIFGSIIGIFSVLLVVKNVDIVYKKIKSVL